MTVCASPGLSAALEQEGAPPPSAAGEDGARPAAGCAITVDGAYAARLARSGGSWYPERWTLDGPEPYAVPLPADQPEEPGTEVQPMSDGRVLIRRLVEGRHTFSLLYPTDPGTGELPLGAVECPDRTRMRLLPCAPGGERAYALAVGPLSSAVWLVAGGAFGPELLAEVPGHCSGGVWLDRAGRMLALDRRTGGRTKAVVVDLGGGGEVSPLLQIAPHSDDRLLLADPDSGLLLIRSDAPSPGRARLGWGVLGSTLPVRFPRCLQLPDCVVTPFAIQPGQVLTPEQCAVALRCDGPFGDWVGVWRPAERRLRHVSAPEGWLTGAGVWTDEGTLRLPFSTGAVPCGVARWTASAREPADARAALPGPLPAALPPAPPPALPPVPPPALPSPLPAALAPAARPGPMPPALAPLPVPLPAARRASPGIRGARWVPVRRASALPAPAGAADGGPGGGPDGGPWDTDPGDGNPHPVPPAQTPQAAQPSHAPQHSQAPQRSQTPQGPHQQTVGPRTANARSPHPSAALPTSAPPPPDGLPQPPEPEPPTPVAPRPVTLQQAARTGRMTGPVTGRVAGR
ncbi:hypothetical protein [Streptomyces sp. NPDC021356]|uniref:hypothetical protein n=1 Tax=Streptomyces sp. NPDC021356 TaxID=3154900 RepID=UPI0033FE02D2